LTAAPQNKREEKTGAVVLWAALLFALTVAGALPFIFAGRGLDQVKEPDPPPPMLLAGILLTGYAPTLAALLVRLVVPGEGGMRYFVQQFAKGHAGAGWYLLVFVPPIGIVLAADAIYFLAGGAAPRAWFAVPQNLATAAFWGPLVAGCLGEEPGWRGFALPRLAGRFGALWASIVIGVLWGTWHLWPAITPGGLSHVTPADLLQTYVRMISTSILYAWAYNSTGGSLPLVMAAHAGHNLAIDFIPLHHDDAGVVALIIAFLYLLAAITVVLSTEPRTLARAKDRAVPDGGEE
jgi:membrane protease YdiL (CAAX protease family)